MARGIRFEVTVCSNNEWKPSFSRMVITGSKPTVGSQILAGEVKRRGSIDFIGFRRAFPLANAGSKLCIAEVAENTRRKWPLIRPAGLPLASRIGIC